MGLFNRYREDVERVGEALGPILGGALSGPGDDKISWRVAGTRGGRSVHVELNQMHGIYGIGCAIRELGVGSVSLRDDRSIFATSRQPVVAGRLKAETRWDAAALWRRLPDITRHVIATMLAGEGSSLWLRSGELGALIGASGVLRTDGVVDRIVQDLDRLLVIAQVMEDVWDIDPAQVGIGQHVLPPEPAPPPPPVAPRDAAAIARRARPAYDAMVARHAGATIPLFPAADAFRARLGVKDRIVILPPTPPSRWVRDFTYQVVVAGSVADGWYFARTHGEGFQRVLAAVERHGRATGAQLGDAAYEVIGQLTGDPRLVVVDGAAHAGLDVAVLGALVGDGVFVDATVVVDGQSPYAGEHD